VISALLIAVATYYAFWGGEYTAFDLGRISMRQKAEAARLAAIRTDVDSLRTVAEALESDPATIERVARERFGMIREGETLYRFVDLGEDAPEAATP
jgi:cell division protein FtsB